MFFNRGFGGMHGGGDDDDDDEGQQHGGRGGPKEQDDDPDHKKLYDALGVDKKASAADITKSFRKLAMTHHPDRGGDQEKFKAISHAYEILSNEEKRSNYDKYGEKGVENGGGGGRGGMDMHDLFDMLHGGGGRGGNRRRKGEDVVFPLKVELHELYKGGVKKLKLTKNVLCKACKGKGGKDGIAASKCVSCRGQGVKMVVRQIGPGMIQQMQVQCPQCDGRGDVMADKDKCTDCHGERTVKESKTLEVAISTGMSHGQRITFKQEADQAPDTEPGDVVVVLQQKEHSMFQRQNQNLWMKKSITLSEALAGFEFKVPHFEKTLHIKSEPGMIVKPGDIKICKEYGMPYLKSMLNFGHLFIRFDVVFPLSKSLDLKARETITKLLGGSMPVDEKSPAVAAPASAAAAGPSAPGGPKTGTTQPVAGTTPSAAANIASANKAKPSKENRKARRAAAAAAAASGKPVPKDAGSDDDLPPLEKTDGDGGAATAAAAATGSGSAAAASEEDVMLEDCDYETERQRWKHEAESGSHGRGEAHGDDDDDDPRHAHGGQPGCRAQ